MQLSYVRALVGLGTYHFCYVPVQIYSFMYDKTLDTESVLITDLRWRVYTSAGT
jgi:hypothetical protein